MENASKALIIAGAILLSILIIAIGMYIYNSSQGAITGAATQMTSTEIQSFNRLWEMYEGTQTGTNVKDLISKLISNAKASENATERIPSIRYYSINKSDKVDVKYSVDNPSDYTAALDTARSDIAARHNYYVVMKVDSNSSLIKTIYVLYDESQKSSLPTTVPDTL